MEIVFQILGYLSIPMLLLSLFAMVKSLNRQRPIIPRGLLIQLGISIVFLVVYSLLLNVSPPTILSYGLMGTGITFGSFWSRTTKLSIKKGAVYGKRSIWYMAIWVLSIAITQTLAMTSTQELVAYGLSTIYLTTGIAIGTNLRLLFQQRRLATVSINGSITCPHCGIINNRSLKFCTQCGRSL
jgi:hypothetical protein